jgi:hypothetical protein
MRRTRFFPETGAMTTLRDRWRSKTRERRLRVVQAVLAGGTGDRRQPAGLPEAVAAFRAELHLASSYAGAAAPARDAAT